MIVIGSDHTGIELKKKIINHLKEKNIEYLDVTKISIACNKVKKIRAAVCTDVYMAELTRKDNDANVLCLGSRLNSIQENNSVYDIVDIFISTKFQGGRHKRRIDKITSIEEGKEYGNNI